MVFRWRGFLVAVLFAGIPLAAWAQTGAVEGHVFCSDGNVPAREAEVHLVPLASLLPQSKGTKVTGESEQSETDFGGNYVFPSVPAGTYIVYVEMAGYSGDFRLVEGALGRFTLDQRKRLLSEFPQVTVRAGSTANEDVVIDRGGAITGRVTVDLGGTLGRPTYVTATMVSSDLLGDVSGGAGEKAVYFAQTGLTDDRGVYRIAGLPAGKYRIEVRLSESYYHFVDTNGGGHAMEPTRTGTGSVTVFAPDALKKSDAKLVSVGDGDELSGVDITIPMSRLHSIGGTVTRGGAPLAEASVSIYRAGKRASGSDALSTSDGSYRFDLLPPGTYTIKATYPTETTFPVQKHSRHFTGTMTFLLGDHDIVDANIDVPLQANGK